MRATVVWAVLVVFGVVGSPPARAERAPEGRDKATYVFTGTVEAVFQRDDGDSVGYVVRIRIEKVHKGPGYKPGEVFYASCYRIKLGSRAARMQGAGFGDPPKEGQRIKALVKRRDGDHEGVFPDWYEVLDKGKRRSRP